MPLRQQRLRLWPSVKPLHLWSQLMWG